MRCVGTGRVRYRTGRGRISPAGSMLNRPPPSQMSHLRRPAPRTILNHMVHYARQLDASFAALSDPTRRGILERLARSDASISDLAEHFEMTLTGIRKHVRTLESAGLVSTK